MYARRSACRDALLRLLRTVGVVVRREKNASPGKARSPRWSDCGCGACLAWRGTGGDRLHFVVQEPPAPTKDASATRSDNDADDAIFIHGFTSSPSFWAQTVFPELATANRRLLAVDLLGFGGSPKPANCAYTLGDHVEAIERSLIDPLNLTSFHLVSHSMGCTVAIALAAKHPARIKSITLVAPPYFLPCEEKAASQVALGRLAEKKLWPPMMFGSAVMSWYEHIGRTVCFVVCKNHRVWERLIRIVTRTSGVDFLVRDLTRHTHHSAWHTMHNVICGGAGMQDRNLEVLAAAEVPVRVVHGDGDQVVPVECSSRHLRSKVPRAELRIVGGRDHRTVVFGREKEFAGELRAFWSACEKPSQ